MTEKKKIAKIVDKKINTRNANMIDNRDREGETLGSVGPFVKVTWNDAASTFKTYRINGENPSEHLTVCETLGELVAEDGCDIMAIPRDWCQSIEVLESVGTAIDNWNEIKNEICTLENLEHQQELADVPAKKK